MLPIITRGKPRGDYITHRSLDYGFQLSISLYEINYEFLIRCLMILENLLKSKDQRLCIS